MPTIFTDATPSAQRSCYRVASVRYQSYATSVYAPNWVTDQQSAELYAIFHGLRQACLRKLTYVCLVTDNSSAYFTLISGKISSKNRTRLRILRRIHRLIYQNNCQVQLMWIPLKLNLADPFSRSQNYLPVPTSFNPDEVLNHLSTCQTLKRFWWRH